VKSEGGTNFVVMVSAQPSAPRERTSVVREVERVLVSAPQVFLKAECDFQNKTDQARFFYSLDGKSWTAIGSELKMSYTIPHFMGYRFGLFNYATKEAGGHADFDFFHITDQIAAAQ
jgi:beta-xylosidase